MPITIIQPKPTQRYTGSRRDEAIAASTTNSDSSDSDSDSDVGGVDIEGDIAMQIKKESRRPAKRARHGGGGYGGQQYGKSDIVTPGEIITDDPQWMRFVTMFPTPPPSPPLNRISC